MDTPPTNEIISAEYIAHLLGVKESRKQNKGSEYELTNAETFTRLSGN